MPCRPGFCCRYHLSCPTKTCHGATPFWIGHLAETAWMMNTVGAHCSFRSLASAAMSGRPVAVPALSTQLVMGDTSGLNSALPPTIAKALEQASMSPFLLSVGSSLLSHVLTLSWRQAMPPWVLT